MEKTLRYLLITFAVMMVMSVSAQSLAQEPQIGFQSTSSMVGSGSTLPQAALEGVSTIGDGTEGVERINSNIRKGRPGDWTEPYDDPIGDGVIALLALAAMYAVFRIRRKCVKRLN